MKTMMKKNQLMITALAIMIAIAGYLQFAENTMDGKVETQGIREVDSGKVITENYNADAWEDSDYDLAMDIASLDSDVTVMMDDYLEEGMEVAENTYDAETASVSATPDAGEIPGEAVFTSSGALEVLADAKLLKEQTRAKNKETLLSVLGNEYLNEEQKQTAVNSMVEMTQIAEKEAAAEILLEAKGFSDVVVSINGDGVDVVVNAAELTESQRAQIEDIVMRKTNTTPENIIISTVVRP